MDIRTLEDRTCGQYELTDEYEYLELRKPASLSDFLNEDLVLVEHATPPTEDGAFSKVLVCELSTGNFYFISQGAVTYYGVLYHWLEIEPVELVPTSFYADEGVARAALGSQSLDGATNPLDQLILQEELHLEAALT